MVRVKQLLGRKGPDVWSVDADVPVLEAIQLMADRHVGSALVTRGDKLVGIFTTTDACRALARVLHELHPDKGPDEVA